MIKVAINGFGRIGRPVLKRILDGNFDLEVVAINDLADREALEHLFKYDSVYGIYEKKISEKTKFFSENDPSQIPWRELGVDIVLECSGEFTEIKEAEKHLEAGAKKIIISAPSKSEEVKTFVLGVNEEKYDAKKDDIVSMASCTTNCLAPIAKVLNDNFKIVRGFMTTSHSYTNDQRILDLPHKDLRRARAAGLNIIPTTTGAALAIGKVLPELEGKLDGIALRIPTPTVSILDLICQIDKKTTAEKINDVLRKSSPELQGILRVEDEPLVSSDFKGDSFSAIVDSNLTMAKDNLIKVVAWYDNEYAYACRLAEFTEFIGKKL